MKWFSGNTIPTDLTTEYVFKIKDTLSEGRIETKLCVCDNAANSFKENEFGRNPIHKSLIIKWVYIEEDDDILEDETALETISAAVSHVKNLIQLLLTDCISASSKEYRDKIGIDHLLAFDKKITERIVELDDHCSE